MVYTKIPIRTNWQFSLIRFMKPHESEIFLNFLNVFANSCSQFLKTFLALLIHREINAVPIFEVSKIAIFTGALMKSI